MAPRQKPTLDELVLDLRRIARVGLPIRVPDQATPILRLRGVRARAGTNQLADLASAADGQLRHIILSFGDGPDGRAAKALFGISAGTRGLNLTERRELAAQAVDRHVDHWRKHLERDMLKLIGQEFYQREQLYLPRQAEVSGYDPVELPEIVQTSNPAELVRQESTARIAAALYEYRADLLATYRFQLTDPHSRASEMAIKTALYSFTRLLFLINVHLRDVGDRVMLGDSPVSMTSLIQIAGWHPPFNRAERDLLVLTFARVDGDRRQFLNDLMAVQGGPALERTWTEHLSA